MRATILTLGLSFLLASCGYAEWREAQKQEEKARNYVPEPTYCYQSIGEAYCFTTPYHRDQRRIVSFFGPSPGNYPKPAPPPPAPHAPPAMTNYWVKDAEPVPLPAEPMQPAPPSVRKAPVTRVPLK
jgi:hypothetical protein